jgi:hypothetical protein
MKFSKSTRALSLCLLLALILGACLPGFAESKKPALITGRGVLWVGSGRSPVVATNLPSDAKSFFVTSSKPSVIKVGRQKDFGPYGWYMEPLKPGKAKITLKYKTEGKTRSVSATFIVEKYPNPFEYIKVNGKKIKLKDGQSNLFLEDYNKNTITISYKLKRSWKLTGLEGNRVKGDIWYECDWKKGKAINLKGYNAADLVIDMEEVRGTATCSFEIIITR